MNAKPKQAHPFYSSPAWRALRSRALKRDGYRCTFCDASVIGFGKSRVDHIVPMKQAPHLRLALHNVRTLCIACDAKRHRDKGGGPAVQGCNKDGQPNDPQHWWNK